MLHSRVYIHEVMMRNDKGLCNRIWGLQDLEFGGIWGHTVGFGAYTVGLGVTIIYFLGNICIGGHDAHDCS